ncbi:MAG: Gfo/Idh/MocA family protein [Pseudonocardiaceae bacterium]
MYISSRNTGQRSRGRNNVHDRKDIELTDVRRLRTAIVGTGIIAKSRYFPIMQKLLELFEVHALCDIDQDALDRANLIFPYARTYASLHEMITDHTLSLECVLLLSSGNHQEPLSMLAKMSIPVFVEKPLAYEYESARACADEFTRRQVPLHVGYMKRYYRTVERLTNVMTSEEITSMSLDLVHPPEDTYLLPVIGETRPATTDLCTFLDSETRRPNVSETLARIGVPDQDLNARRAYVLLATSVIHDINLMQAIAGTPSEVPFAHFWNKGLCGRVILNYSDSLTATLTYSYVDTAGHEETLRLVGPTGRWTAHFPSPYLPHSPATLHTVRGAHGGLPDEQFEQISLSDPFELQLKDFHDAIVHDRPPTINGYDGVADLALIERIIHATTAPSR